MTQSENPFKQFGRWVREQIVQDVPDDIALCELDCRKGQCTTGEWEECKRRLDKAAGKLMPAADGKPADEEAGKEETASDAYCGEETFVRESGT